MSLEPQNKNGGTLDPYYSVERSSKQVLVAHPLRRLRLRPSRFCSGIFCAVALVLIGCNPPTKPPAVEVMSAILPVDLSVPTQPVLRPEGIQLSSAKNSWTQFEIQLDRSKLLAHPFLRLPPMPAGITFAAFQILPAPVDLNDAEYVRQTGDLDILADVPRVLFSLPVLNGSVDLSGLRSVKGPTYLWIDVHIADQVTAGEYKGQCDLLGSSSGGNIQLQLTVENLTLPADRHLHFSAGLDWSTLSSLYPDLFEAVPPRLLNRGDPRRTGLLELIGQYFQLAHENNADLYMPRLQPIVKWPLGKMPDVDWTDFDSVAAPWLNGNAFSDHRPVEFWPLPSPDSLAGFDLLTRTQYWQVAAEHFEKRGWLNRSPIVLKDESGGEPTQADSILLSAEARQILAVHPHVKTLLPLRDEQVELVSTGNSNAISLDSVGRLIDVAGGLVHPDTMQNWTGAQQWVDATDGVTASASQQGMQSLAWLAFSQDATLVLCGNPLPTPGSAAKASQLIWAYPGQSFGADHPLATIQLKWIRQAEQDYEYLLLARQRQLDVAKVCRLVTRPVHQQRENLFDLFAGNTESHGCDKARQLLVNELTHPPAATSAVNSANLQSLRWFADQEKQSLCATGVSWTWNLNAPTFDGENKINAALTLDIYNPAATMPNGGHISGQGWQTDPLPAIPQFHVSQITAHAQFDLSKITPDSRQPIALNFTDDFTGTSTPCSVSIPLAVSQRLQHPLLLDGNLDDWFPADAIQLNQPLVKILDRPSVQGGKPEFSDTPSSIYTGWSNDNFYLAFRLGGVTALDLRSTRNFVQYDHGRAWGEDLCELLIQPIYIDNTMGAALHVVCKPGGSWVEQQSDQKSWQPFEACGLRYASGVEPSEKVWRGEVAIPWKAINATGHGRPALLRFNFIQHQQATAQTASWAGPIDESRDGKLAGLLYLKEP